MVEKNNESLVQEVELKRDFFVLAIDIEGDVDEVYSIESTKPDVLLDKIRYLSDDNGISKIVVTTADHQEILRGIRDSAGKWQLEVVSSELIKQLQTDIRKSQWSKHWIFETDRPKR